MVPPFASATLLGVCVECGRGNGGGAGESQEAGHIMGMLLSLGSPGQ